MDFKIAVIPGDGIGPEVIDEAIRVLSKVGKKYNRRTLFRMKQLYNLFGEEKVSPQVTQLTWTHYLILMKLKNYDEIKYYTDYQLFGKVIEEKVVQLSWVNVLGDIYLGAHTQFTTVQFRSMLSSYAYPDVFEDSDFIYYRTENYQSPQNIARLNWGNTWIEKISSYKFNGVTFPSLQV